MMIKEGLWFIDSWILYCISYTLILFDSRLLKCRGLDKVTLFPLKFLKALVVLDFFRQ